MVQGKNVLSTFMHSFFALGLVTRAVRGDRLLARVRARRMARRDRRPRLRRARRASTTTTACTTRSRTLAFVAYQCMFAVITPALISGAFAERMKFSAYALFTLAGRRWSTIRSRTGSWAAGGWLAQARRDRLRGRHGRAPVVGRLGARRARSCSASARGYPNDAPPAAQPDDDRARRRPPVVRLVRLQRRRALARTARAALALVNTHLAAAAGALTWALVEGARIQQGHDARRRVGPGRGPGRDHAGRRLRVADGRARDRRRRRASSATARVLLKAQARLRRRARRVRRPRRRRRDRRAAHRRVRARGAQQRQRRRARRCSASRRSASLAAGAWAAVVTFVLLKVIDATVGLRVDAGDRARRPRRRAARRVCLRWRERPRAISMSGSSSVKTD